MSDIARPITPAPLGDLTPKSDKIADRPALRDTGFFSAAEIQRALRGYTPPTPQGDEPAQGC